MILTETRIRALFQDELARALGLFPAESWSHPFSRLEFNRASRSFGHAHASGRITLSRRFIGIAAEEDLVDTVRHELAHLIVGIEKKHGPRWKAVAQRLGCNPRATHATRSADLARRMNQSPYRLVAITSDGSAVELKAAHRRLRKYKDYAPTPGLRYHLRDGRLITRFIYRESRLETDASDS